MSFVLRGTARELRFSGETRALGSQPADDAAPLSVSSELGKPRVRRAAASLAPPPSVVPPPAVPPSRRPQTIDTPTRIGGPAVRIPAGFVPPRTVRVDGSPYDPVVPTIDPDPSIDDDECKTTALVRDGLDVLPGAHAILAPKPARAAEPIPIPHFRSRSAVQANAKTVLVPRRAMKRSARLPLAVWLVAAAVASLVSFRFVPDVVARFDPALAQR